MIIECAHSKNIIFKVNGTRTPISEVVNKIIQKEGEDIKIKSQDEVFDYQGHEFSLERKVIILYFKRESDGKIIRVIQGSSRAAKKAIARALSLIALGHEHFFGA